MKINKKCTHAHTHTHTHTHFQFFLFFYLFFFFMFMLSWDFSKQDHLFQSIWAKKSHKKHLFMHAKTNKESVKNLKA